MPKLLAYRRRLLAIVNAFLDPTEASHTRARHLLKRLYHDPRRRSQTVDDLVWGTFVSELTDADFCEDAAYLQATRNTLLHGSPELHRAYLSYDFRPLFSEVERDWHTQLQELAAWLQTQPFHDITAESLARSERTAAHAEYEQHIQVIRTLSEHSPVPAHVGEEMLYHLILRTASAVLSTIDAFYSARYGYLAAAGPYTAYHWNPAQPAALRCPIDASDSVSWASRALQAITLHDWVWWTWQVTSTSYLVSLH
jgi:hypothetical protein